MNDIMNFDSFFLLYYFMVNIFEFIYMGIDKRNAVKNKYRVSEKRLLLLGLIGGAIGGLFAMPFYKHKTKKKKFYIVFILSIIIHLFLWIYIFRNVNNF